MGTIVKPRPTHKQIIDSAEHFYKLPITKDRQFIITTSASCQKDHYAAGSYTKDFTIKVWCSLAHEGKAYGSLFWCPCPCHGQPKVDTIDAPPVG